MLERDLTDSEIGYLTSQNSLPATSHTMEGDDIVMLHLYSQDASIAPTAAAAYVQRITGVTATSTQLLP